MNITLTIGKLINSTNAINMLLTARPNGNAPRAALAMAIGAVGRAMDPHVAGYNTALQAARAKYKNAPKETREQDFQKELDELRAMEVELAGIGNISLAALDADGVRLTAQEIIELDWLLLQDVKPEFAKE